LTIIEEASEKANLKKKLAINIVSNHYAEINLFDEGCMTAYYYRSNLLTKIAARMRHGGGRNGGVAGHRGAVRSYVTAAAASTLAGVKCCETVKLI